MRIPTFSRHSDTDNDEPTTVATGTNTTPVPPRHTRDDEPTLTDGRAVRDEREDRTAELRDERAAANRDANVTARAEAVSPRLPGQPNSGRAQGNGVYNIPVVLAVASSYRIQVQAARSGLPTATFSFLIDAPH